GWPNNTCNYSAAIVDASSTPNASPCSGRGMEAEGSAVSNFVLRDVTIRGASGANGIGNEVFTSTVSNNVTLERVRFTGMVNTGLWVGGTGATGDQPCTGGRTVTNLVIADCQFDHNGAASTNMQGLMIGCVDGGQMRNTAAFNNGIQGPACNN